MSWKEDWELVDPLSGASWSPNVEQVQRSETTRSSVTLFSDGTIETSPDLCSLRPHYEKRLLKPFLSSLASKSGEEQFMTEDDESMSDVKEELVERKRPSIGTSLRPLGSTQRRQPPRQLVNGPTCLKQERGTLLTDVKGRPTDEKKTFRADDREGIEMYHREALKYFGGTVRHTVAEKWIAMLIPKKSSKCAYQGRHSKIPHWWPEHIKHTGPQHLKKEAQIDWYIDMFKGRKAKRFSENSDEGSWEWFWDGVCKSRCRLEEKLPKTKSLEVVLGIFYDMLKLLKHQQRFDRGEIDGDATTDVRPIPARSPRMKEKAPKSEQKDNAFKDDGNSATCDTPTTMEEEEEEEPVQESKVEQASLDQGSSDGLPRTDQNPNTAPYFSFFPQLESSTYQAEAMPSSSHAEPDTMAPNRNSQAQVILGSSQAPDLHGDLVNTMSLTPQHEWDEAFTDVENLQIQLRQTQLLAPWDSDMTGIAQNHALYTPNLPHQALEHQAQYHGSLLQDPLLLEQNGHRFEQSQGLPSTYQIGNHQVALQHDSEIDANHSHFR